MPSVPMPPTAFSGPLPTSVTPSRLPSKNGPIARTLSSPRFAKFRSNSSAYNENEALFLNRQRLPVVTANNIRPESNANRAAAVAAGTKAAAAEASRRRKMPRQRWLSAAAPKISKWKLWQWNEKANFPLCGPEIPFHPALPDSPGWRLRPSAESANPIPIGKRLSAPSMSGFPPVSIPKNPQKRISFSPNKRSKKFKKSFRPCRTSRYRRGLDEERLHRETPQPAPYGRTQIYPNRIRPVSPFPRLRTSLAHPSFHFFALERPAATRTRLGKSSFPCNRSSGLGYPFSLPAPSRTSFN